MTNTGICARIIHITESTLRGYGGRVLIELDDDRTTKTRFSFDYKSDLRFPFNSKDEIVLTLKKSER